MKSLPSRASRRGVSRFEPMTLTVANCEESEIRSSPVYAGHTIKPLIELAYFYESSCAGACSLGQDRGRPARRKTPARIPPKRWLPFPSSNPCGCPEGNGLLSFRVFRNACTDVPATRQHVRKALFNESLSTCQALNCPNSGRPLALICQVPWTAYGNLLPEKNASRLAITQSCIPVWDSSV